MLAFQTFVMVFAAIVQTVCFVAAIMIPVAMIAWLADMRGNMRDGREPIGRMLSLRWMLGVVVLPIVLYLMMFVINATSLKQQTVADVSFYASFAFVVGALLCVVYLAYREYAIREGGLGIRATISVRRVMWRAKWLHPVQYYKARQRLQEQGASSRPVSLQKESSDS